MTSPTGPDRDRLPASDAGQEKAFRTGLCRANQHDACARQRISQRCDCDCHAPQQPPAQERPEPGSEAWGEMIAANKAAGWHCGRGLAEGYCDNPDHARKGAHPPSEADSADEDEDCGHHSWAGLMQLLDQHWPDDIWPTLHHDDLARDTGARLISLTRWVDQLRVQLAIVTETSEHRRAERDALTASSGVRGGDDQARAAGWHEGYRAGRADAAGGQP